MFVKLAVLTMLVKLAVLTMLVKLAVLMILRKLAELIYPAVPRPKIVDVRDVPPIPAKLRP